MVSDGDLLVPRGVASDEVGPDTSPNPMTIVASAAIDATRTKAAFTGRWENTVYSKIELRVGTLFDVIASAVPGDLHGGSRFSLPIPTICHSLGARLPLNPSICEGEVATSTISESNWRCR